MSLFAGFAAGWGEGLGKQNQRMMDYFTKKSESLSQLYGGLANNILQAGGDQELAAEFLERSKGWSTANPLFDPKGYQKLIKGEKSIHDLIDISAQRDMSRTMPQMPQGSQQPTEGQEASSNSMPNMQDMISQISGGRPLFGPLGIPTFAGKMTMSAMPQILQNRMEWQHKTSMMQQLLQGRNLEDMPPGEAEQVITTARGMGLNLPVPQIRHIPRALYLDPDTQQPRLGPIRVNFRNTAAWVETPAGEKRVVTLDEAPQLSIRPDGSTWVTTLMGSFPLGGLMAPIQAGTQRTSEPTPGGGTYNQDIKVFSNATPDPIPTGEPEVGNILPPGLPIDDAGPPVSRTSTPKPNEAYTGTGKGFSLERLETARDPIAQQVAAYIKQPEAFDLTGPRREMWNQYFRQYTNGAVKNAPVPISQLGENFKRQRLAIVNGFNATKNISNILLDTDGRIVGIIAGRWVEFMNKVGLAKGISAMGDIADPNDIQSMFAVMQTLAKERPGLAAQLAKDPNLLAQKAASLVTNMRIFNFQDVRNTIGGVQGVASTYKNLKDALVNPGMDLPLILGHLSALNINMADGLLMLEQSRWGDIVPYIREKELMSKLYFGPYIDGKIKAAQANAAAKGINLSKQDALFILWRRGQLEADPGNRINP